MARHIGTYRGERLRQRRRQAMVRVACNVLTAFGLGMLAAGALTWAYAFGAML